LAQLIAAVDANDVEQMKKLLETGIDVTKTELISLAAGKGLAEIVSLLIAHHADVNARARDKYKNWTPLMFAASQNHPEVIRLLIAAGADKNAQDSEGYTALMRAIDTSSADAVNELLDAGADATIKSTWLLGESACSLARKRNPRMRTILMQHDIRC
jgi:ankyrin repeat protein